MTPLVTKLIYIYAFVKLNQQKYKGTEIFLDDVNLTY